MAEEIVYRPIGIIHTPYLDKEKTPIQGYYAPDNSGTVEVFPEFAAGLQDIAGFSHLILLYHFHRSGKCELIAKPFLDKEKHGIFAIRYFNRPNSIGLTVVNLKAVNDNMLEVSGVDMLDGTPLLDIKPYVPQFDIKEDAREGWFRTASEKDRYKIEKG
jgi:tRNA (adenine37-N6)-methyltransferase